jgi:hypothetical protein
MKRVGLKACEGGWGMGPGSTRTRCRGICAGLVVGGLVASVSHAVCVYVVGGGAAVGAGVWVGMGMCVACVVDVCGRACGVGGLWVCGRVLERSPQSLIGRIRRVYPFNSCPSAGAVRTLRGSKVTKVVDGAMEGMNHAHPA